MAGTPTPNYQFPTYAETDTPNLAGAYNQAVNAIDAKIKEVADSVSSGGDVPNATSTTKGIAKLYDSATVGAGNQDDGGITPKAVDDKIGGSLTGYAPKFTAAAPITYSGNQIGIRYSNPAADGAQNGYGAVQVTGKQSDVASADSLTTATVPNVKAVKDYVDAKVPTEQLAYTGIAPVMVNSGNRTIEVNRFTQLNSENVDSFMSDSGNPSYRGYCPAVANAGTIIDKLNTGTAEQGYPQGRSVPSVFAMAEYVNAHTPDASTSTKGLVQLNGGQNTNASENTMALTMAGLTAGILATRDSSVTKLDVAMLSNIYIHDDTGLLFYKAPTE